MVTRTAASLPPDGLPGLDPAWSRLVTVPAGSSTPFTWHLLDTHASVDAGNAADPGRDPSGVRITLLCVHGNPTWSYLWRRLLRATPPDISVIAVDQLDMGFSERTGEYRSLSQRVRDLGALTDALNLEGPIIVVAHDWGGPVSLGWALDHRPQVKGVCLLNTAVHQPASSTAPRIIRAARWRPVRRAVTVDTATFIRGTTALSSGRVTPQEIDAYRAPYRTPDRRSAIGDFVADIPLEANHPSAPELDRIAEGIRHLDVPALLLWGPGDPVFSDRYLHDLENRLPQAQVHRYAGARHLVIEDAPALVDDLLTWVGDVLEGREKAPSGTGADGTRETASTSSESSRLWSSLMDRARRTPDAVALAEPVDGVWRAVSWSRLGSVVTELAAGLADQGVRRGDRVSVLIPPGADLVAVIYACWRIGASVVVTDAGLGRRGIVRALRSAAPDHLIAIPRGLLLERTRAIRIPGLVVGVADLPALARRGGSLTLPTEPARDQEALVAFTSGSTGPAKGVVYTHGQVEATRDLLRAHYGLTESDGLVAAFAPWAVLGPALGIASVIPDMNLIRPDTLTAHAVADAIAQVGGTVMWASPAAFRGILASADAASDADMTELARLRLVLGAGAPVEASLLHAMARLCGAADVRTPYGMTEVLPVSDVSMAQIDAAGPGPGVLVGHPLPGVEVALSAVDGEGQATGPLTDDRWVLGEIAVRAAHRKLRYDRLWATERASSRDRGWHRTGDVGMIDDDGRLWIGGRLAHVISTPDGPLAPVAIEQAVQALPRVSSAACVGVGLPGAQVPVLVLVVEDGREGPADLPLIDSVRGAARGAAGVEVAAVLLRHELPTDIRHRSKIDRSALAQWAADQLAGHR